MNRLHLTPIFAGACIAAVLLIASPDAIWPRGAIASVFALAAGALATLRRPRFRFGAAMMALISFASAPPQADALVPLAVAWAGAYLVLHSAGDARPEHVGHLLAVLVGAAAIVFGGALIMPQNADVASPLFLFAATAVMLVLASLVALFRHRERTLEVDR